MLNHEVLIITLTCAFVVCLYVGVFLYHKKQNKMVIPSPKITHNVRIMTLSKKLLENKKQVNFLLTKEQSDLLKYGVNTDELKRLLGLLEGVKYQLEYDLDKITITELEKIYHSLQDLDTDISKEKTKVLLLLQKQKENAATFSGYRSRLPSLFATVSQKINETPYYDLKIDELTLIKNIKVMMWSA